MPKEIEDWRTGLLDLFVVLLNLKNVIDGEGWPFIDFCDAVEDFESDDWVLRDHELGGLDEVEQQDIYDDYGDEQNIRDGSPTWDQEED